MSRCILPSGITACTPCMYGNADGKNFICTFNSEGKFVAVDDTGNPDGDL